MRFYRFFYRQPGLPDHNLMTGIGSLAGVGRKKKLPLHGIMAKIKTCKGNIRWAAHNLGLARFTLYNRLKKAGVKLEDFRPQ